MQSLPSAPTQPGNLPGTIVGDEGYASNPPSYIPSSGQRGPVPYGGRDYPPHVYQKIPKTTTPSTRRLGWEGFWYSPWCPIHSGSYRQVIRDIGTTEQPFAIEYLDDPSDKPWREQLSEPWKTPIEGNQTTQPIIASAPGASSQPPSWIRVNSKPILDFLASCTYSRTDQTRPQDSVIMPHPYKVLVEYEPYIRQHYEQLQHDWEFEPLTSEPPGEEKEPATDLDPDPDSKDTRTESDEDSTKTTRQHTKVQKGEKFPELDTALTHFQCLISFLDETIKPKYEAYRHSFHPNISFRDLWFLFRPGDEVFDTSRQSQRAPLIAPSWEALLEAERPPLWKVVHLTSGTPQKTGEPFVIEAFYIDHDGMGFIPVSRTFEIQPFEGERNIQSLGLFPLKYHSNHEEVRAEILSEGRQFLDYTKLGPAYRYYNDGSVNRDSSSGLASTSENIDTEVIVDFKEARERGVVPQPCLPPSMNLPQHDFHSQLYGLWNSALPTSGCSDCGRTPDDIKIDKSMSERALKHHGFLSRFRITFPGAWIDGSTLADEELVLLPRFVPAFALPDGQYMSSWTKGLTPVEKHETLWSDLSLWTGQKELLFAHVKSQFQKVARVSKPVTQSRLGKRTAEGRVVLLHGPHGVGKSSAVHALAAKISRPLFRTDGNGYSPNRDLVGGQLARRFARAEKWQSVFLIDKADKLVSTLRSIGCLSRKSSSLSCGEAALNYPLVLLHQLNCYGGFVVLTANSIEEFDDALKSHIHLTLFFPYFSKLQALDVWKTKMRRLQEVPGRELRVHEEQVVGIFHRFWETETTKMTGRYIENTFQSAVTLAECEVEQDAQLPITLGAQHFHTVIEATLEPERAATEAPQQFQQAPTPPALPKAQTHALKPTHQSHSAPPHQDLSPQPTETEKVLKTLSRALCEDEFIREPLQELSSANNPPYFVAVVERFLELLGRDLVNESDHGSGTQLVKENAGRLAHFMWNHISSPEPLPTEALGTLQKDTLSAFPALFESDALGFFKEDLLEFVKVRGEARKRDMSVDSFLGREIALEEPSLPDDPSRTFFSTLKGFLTEIGLLEPRLKQGYKRVRWKCVGKPSPMAWLLANRLQHCGASLYDDFSDRMPPNAMHDLILRIRRLTGRSNSPPGGIRGFFRTPSPNALGTFTLKSNRSSPEPTIPLFNTPKTGNGKPDQPNIPPKDPLYLLLCMNDGRYASGLRQKEVQELKYDRELFRDLQNTYRAKRGRASSLLSLRAVQSVEFVAVCRLPPFLYSTIYQRAPLITSTCYSSPSCSATSSTCAATNATATTGRAATASLRPRRYRQTPQPSTATSRCRQTGHRRLARTP